MEGSIATLTRLERRNSKKVFRWTSCKLPRANQIPLNNKMSLLNKNNQSRCQPKQSRWKSSKMQEKSRERPKSNHLNLRLLSKKTSRYKTYRSMPSRGTTPTVKAQILTTPTTPVATTRQAIWPRSLLYRRRKSLWFK